MRLYTFEAGNRRSIGAELSGQVVDLPMAYELLQEKRGPISGVPRSLPLEMVAFIRLGEAGLTAARDTLALMKKRPAAPVGAQLAYPLEVVRILAPIPRPGKILCSGINFRGHKEENPHAKMPTEPFFFAKLPTAVIGPGDAIRKPKMTQQLDYEVEFAVIMGKTLKGAEPEAVLDAIFGYTVLHDVSARDVQFKDNQITLGKNFDTFCPLGPCIVTKDELPEPGNCRLRSTLNGKVMQDGTTREWIFPLPELLSFLSRVMTLEAGDVISTGTPAGVGVFQKPPVYLQAGDVVSVEVEGIGRLENRVLDEA